MPTAGGAGTVFRVSFVVDEPLLGPPVVSAQVGASTLSFALDPEITNVSAGEYAFVMTVAAADPEGTASVTARVVDRVGNAEVIALGTLSIDHSSPPINIAALVVTAEPPGTQDTVHGAAGFSEAGATVEVLSDATGATPLATAVVAADGSFAAVNLGDNHTDERGPGLVGQGSFWLRVIDANGNASGLVSFAMDVTPPTFNSVRLAWRYDGDTPLWLDTDAVGGGGSDDPDTRVFVSVQGTLAGAPTVALAEWPGLSVTCALDVVETTTYSCPIHPAGTEDELASSVLTVDVVEQGSGNVGRYTLPAVRFDRTPPSAPNGAGVLVDMQPAGAEDALSVSAGAVEPLSVVEVYRTQTFITPGGFAGCNFLPQATYYADANGAVPSQSIGDNTSGGSRLRQYDAAGNASCTSCFGTCAGSIPLANDTSAPAVALLTQPEAQGVSTDATFRFDLVEQGPLDWQGAPVLSPPVSLFCRLDDAPFAPCDPELSLVSLDPGPHVLRYYATDALDNASTEASVGWRIQPLERLVDAPQLGSVSSRALAMDGTEPHIFVGGDKLYHLYDAGAGFVTEVIDDSPTGWAVARFMNDTFYVAYARVSHTDGLQDTLGVALATGTAGDWSIETALAARIEAEGFDLAVAANGDAVIAAQRCPVAGDPPPCFYAGSGLPTFEVVTVTYSGGTMGTPEVVPQAANAHAPVLEYASNGDLWLAYDAGSPSEGHVATLQVRQGSTWQSPAAGPEGVGSGTGVVRPALLVPSDGAPLLGYKTSTNAAWKLARYTGAAFVAAGSLTSAGRLPAALGPDDRAWFAFPGGGYIGLHDRSSSGTLDDNDIFTSFSPNALALTVSTGGAFGAAELHLAASTYPDGGQSVWYVQQNGASTSDVEAGQGGLISLAPLRGVATPTMVISTVSDGIETVSYAAGSWTSGALVRASSAGRGKSVSAAAGAGQVWVAHVSSVDSGFGRDRVLIEHDAGAGYVTLGAVSPDTDHAQRPLLTPRVDGSPALGWVHGTNAISLMVTWWTGAAFAAPTEIASFANSWDLVSYDILGDVGTGSGNPSELWVATTGVDGLVVTRLDPSTENTGTLSCDTCTSETLDFGVTDGAVQVSLGTTGEPVLRYTHGSGYSLTQASYAGSWSYDSLSNRVVAKRFDFDAAAWVDTAATCYFGSAVRARLEGGLLRFTGRADCNFAGGTHYVLGVEDASGDIHVYPVSAVTESFILDGGAIFADGSSSVVVWPAPVDGDVWSFSEADL